MTMTITIQFFKSAGFRICGQRKRKKKTFSHISGVQSPGLEREDLINTGLLENILYTEGKIHLLMVSHIKYYRNWQIALTLPEKGTINLWIDISFLENLYKLLECVNSS